jgi:VWFA-related protein
MRPTRNHLALAAVLTLAALTGSLRRSALAAEAEVRETVDVRIVTVDVWVTDRHGDSVKGLEAGDFDVLEDGRRVPIRHFVEFVDGSPRPAPAPATTESGPDALETPAPRVPDHLIVYLDRSRMRPSSYQSALADIGEFLSSAAVEAENVLVLRQDRGLAIVSPFGSSREELGQAIAQLSREAPTGADLDNEVQLALDSIRASWDQSRDVAGNASDLLSNVPGAPQGGAGGGGSPREVTSNRGSDMGMGADACRTFYSQIQPTLDAWSRNRTQRAAITLAHLSEITTSLAGLPGSKSLLYFSDGLETQPGMALASYANGLCPGRGTQLLDSSRAKDVKTAFLELTRRAASSRVTIYPLETVGLKPGGLRAASAGRSSGDIGGIRAQSGFESAHRLGEREGLHLIADETGGRVVLDRSELGPELQRIVEESGDRYSLAYEPARGESAAASGGLRREHFIEVRVPDGLTARYRRGYVEQDVESWMMERILGAMNLGIAENPLDARLGAGEVSEAEGGRYRFPLHVMVPVERVTFEGNTEPRIAEIQVTVLARHLDTGTVVRRDQSYRLQTRPGAGGFADLPIVLELEGGVHVTAVGVRDLGSREASFVSTTVQVGGER